MELRQLRYFVALAERLNFTVAAASVHVTQSTLSHQIRQLEEQVGHALFVRTPRNVRLTLEGQALLGVARRVLQDLDTALIGLQAPEEARPVVSIGVTPTFSIAIVPACAAALLERYPQVRLRVDESTPEAIERGLLDGSLDAGIAYPPTDASGLLAQPLFDEEMVVCAHPDDPLAARRTLRMAELHGRPVVMPSPVYTVRTLLDHLFETVGARPRVVAETAAFATALDMVRRARVLAILPETIAVEATGVRTLRLHQPSVTRRPTLYVRDGVRRTEPVEFLVAAIARESAAHARRLRALRARPARHDPWDRLCEIAHSPSAPR